MTLRRTAVVLLCLAAVAVRVRGDISCICSTDSCTSRGVTTCTAKQTCFAQYERPLDGSSTTGSDDLDDAADEDYVGDQAAPNDQDEYYDEYDYENDEEAYVTRGCIERTDVVHCDNKGPTAKITFPYVYCCHDDFCNNVHVLNGESDESDSEADEDSNSHPVAFSTRRTSTSWPSLATMAFRKHSRRPETTSTTNANSNFGQSGNPDMLGVRPVYIGLLVCTIAVLVLILIFAVVVFKRYNESRYEPARKVLLFN